MWSSWNLTDSLVILRNLDLAPSKLCLDPPLLALDLPADELVFTSFCVAMSAPQSIPFKLWEWDGLALLLVSVSFWQDLILVFRLHRAGGAHLLITSQSTPEGLRKTWFCRSLLVPSWHQSTASDLLFDTNYLQHQSVFARTPAFFLLWHARAVEAHL